MVVSKIDYAYVGVNNAKGSVLNHLELVIELESDELKEYEVFELTKTPVSHRYYD